MENLFIWEGIKITNPSLYVILVVSAVLWSRFSQLKGHGWFMTLIIPACFLYGTFLTLQIVSWPRLLTICSIPWVLVLALVLYVKYQSYKLKKAGKTVLQPGVYKIPYKP